MLIAVTILLSVVITLIPLIQLLKDEGEVLADRRYMDEQLFDKLQSFLWWPGKSLPHFLYEDSHENTVKASYHFKQEDGLIKGCVVWTNVREEAEEICLYGLPEKK